MKKKIVKIIAASGLAVMMGVGTLCGVLLAPMSGSATTSITSKDNPAKNLLAEEKLVAGKGLGLDPENDPVLYTTESGLDIKFGAATLSSGALTGYTYFTMGAYSGTAVNWVIIGRHSSTTSGTTTGTYAFYPGLSLEEYYKEYPYGGCAYFENWFANEKETITPAGIAVDVEWDKQIVIIKREKYDSISVILSSLEATSEVIDTELSPGQALVISEYALCTSPTANDYNNSALKTKMQSLFDSELGFTEGQKALIIPQYLTNYGTSTTYTSSAYLFPLSCRGENFDAATYFPSASQRVAYPISDRENACYWWTRSGNKSYSTTAYYVYASQGYFDGMSRVDASKWVRPSFVLQIM